MLHNDVRPMLNNDVAAPLRARLGGFASPLTRMMLAGTGLTTPVLEAALGAALRVRGLWQDSVSVEQIPEGIAGELRLVNADRLVLRRSCLADFAMTLVSVNSVICTVGAVTAMGIDRVDAVQMSRFGTEPIGPSNPGQAPS
jgi:hypothetical protein